jgi:anti-anti-sigma factor
MVHHIVRNVAVVVPERDLVTPDEIDALRTIVPSLMQQGRRLFVVNLSKVTATNSEGLGTVVDAYVKVVRSGGLMVLCCAESIVRILNQAKIGHWSAFETEEAAIAYVERKRPR